MIKFIPHLWGFRFFGTHCLCENTKGFEERVYCMKKDRVTVRKGV